MHKIQHNISLKKYNTFGIDALATYFSEVTSVEALKKIIRENTDKKLFFISGGSNMLITSSIIDALVIKLNMKGKKVLREDDDFVWIEAQGGEALHDIVLWSLEHQYGGIENLSLIPGSVGTAPIQNVGAYGVEIKDVLVSCDALNLDTLETETFSNEECAFGYRESFFKNSGKGKYAIVSVLLKLTKRNHTLHLDYGDIRKEIEKKGIENPSVKDVSNAVISIRSAKLPDPSKIGNSGSFFKNPIVDRHTFNTFIANYPEAPFYQISDEEYKIPAGWLIEKAGYKGFRRGDAGVHEKQALVLVNYGNAKGEELLALAEEIQNKVKELFGILILPEVNIVC